LTDERRTQIIRYDIDRTQVMYHGRSYAIDNLEAGDRVAYRSTPRDTGYVDTIRVLEPVQARTGSPTVREVSPRSRGDIVEGTVERVDPRLGTFEVRARSGRMVTVTLPYNARPADVDNFRTLRRGDEVRVEGE